MTPGEIASLRRLASSAETLLRKRDDLNYTIGALRSGKAHRAYVHVTFPRAGPGNDRDERSVEIPFEAAVPLFQAALDEVDQDLAALSAEIKVAWATPHLAFCDAALEAEVM